MPLTKREELLLKMYDQMFNDINRHIIVVWQSIGVLIGAFAIFALVEKNIVSLDIASSIIILLAGWLIAHLYDSAYWYNSNLIIIANIEKQFLEKDDLTKVHYYFGKHRPNKMITHLMIQFALAIGLSTIILLFHFSQRVIPGFSLSISNFELSRAIPYILVILIIIFLLWLRNHCNEKYNELLKNSPGIEIDTSDINYGCGHGFNDK